jgi:pimeloyl-ACP methyl ester carboxylesterase
MRFQEDVQMRATDGSISSFPTPEADDGVLGSVKLSRRQALVLITAVGAVGVLGDQTAAQQPAGDTSVAPVRFDSRGAMIAGDIHLPAGTPTAGIVLVHGSGPERRMGGIARLLARDRFAVLTYDKRGVGGSGGTYEGTNNVSRDNLHLLAADAAAAVDTLAAHMRLQGRRVGLMGMSQAGWIVPIAAAANRRVAFMALWSGPVCRVSDELLFGVASEANIAAETAAHAREGSPAQNVDAIRRYAAQIRADGTDVDPRDSLRELGIPGLWLFGGRDNEIPTEQSVRQLAELIANGKPNFEQRTLPEAGHALDGKFEQAYRITIDWIRTHTAA